MNILLVFQIIVSISLISVVLLQARGTGLGSAWGGSGKSYHSKRGVEKVLFRFTIALAIIFTIASLLAVV